MDKFLCGECRGRCADCKNPVPMYGGFYRTYCNTCRGRRERRELCSKCGKTRDGSHNSYCRACYQRYARDWAAKNPAKAVAKVRRTRLWEKFQITPEQWWEMYDKQKGKCAVCSTTEPRGMGRFHVDHDHATGKLRGLLCTNCNVALGQAKDDPKILRALASYVEKHAAA